MNGRDPLPELAMRPVTLDDADAVIDMYRRLSPQNLFFRFSTLMPDPAPLVRRHLRLVDQVDHGGFIAFDGDEAVGVAQWDRLRDDPGAAELSVAVDERWQHHGLGRALTRAAAGDAYRHAVSSLVASVLSANRAAKRLAVDQQPVAVERDGTETRYAYGLAS
jgi:GNAT superfamily N-acetyltransferase